MEALFGKRTLTLDAEALARRRAGHREMLVDLGTGDGRYVCHAARARPELFALGVDACRENLREASARQLPNALYVIANACRLPHELDGIATWVTINFPWGSLIEGLVAGEAGLLAGLVRLARPGARLEVRLNAGALAEAGYDLEAGARAVAGALGAAGFRVDRPHELAAIDLRAYPSTWAKRLAFGRDPRAVRLIGTLPAAARATAAETAWDAARVVAR